MPLLHPSQRKSFTIDKPTAEFYAAKLARGEKLRFQSYANRNWVAKIARVKYGVNTEVYASKDQLFDPARTVEGWDLASGNTFYMNLYCVEGTKLPQYMPTPSKQPEFQSRLLVAPGRNNYNRREDYVR